MQLKVTAYLMIFICFVPSLRGKALPRKGCYACEEEMWEEVPCASIPSNFTTSSTPVYTSTSSNKPTTPIPKALAYQATTPTSNPSAAKSHEITSPRDSYNKCFYECQLGCKEFCGKVIIGPSETEIAQLSEASKAAEVGRIESTHSLQREYIPRTHQTGDNNHYNCDKTKDYSTHQPLPMQAQPYYKEEYAIEPEEYATYHSKSNEPSENYNSKPIEPIKDPYTIAEVDIDNIHTFDSYPPYYSSPSSDDYNFPIPFENVFSKVTKNLLNPEQSMKISLDDSRGKIKSPVLASYSKSITGNDTPLQTHASLNTYDGSLDSFIKEFISNNPSNEAPYQAQSKPFFSVSYSR